MTQRFSPSQVLKDLRAGPGRAEPPTARQIAVTAEKHPERYVSALSVLFYRMADAQLKAPGRNIVRRYREFSQPWQDGCSDDATRFYFASIDVYTEAIKAGLARMDWQAADAARKVTGTLNSRLPEVATVEGLAWRVFLGQFQSMYSRDEAAATFTQVQQHPDASLVSDFYWDTGSLTYFSEAYVKEHRRPVPTLSELTSWHNEVEPQSERAIVVSMDPNFFRIYAPMILFNAQQLPDLDFVLLLCTSPEESQDLVGDAQTYLSGLSELNGMAAPSNVRIRSLTTPGWVQNETTFYACARFLALPGLLEEYGNVYAMDADLFMLRSPAEFMRKHASTVFGVPETGRLLGMVPWRRYMAGNLIANRDAIYSTVLARFLDYLSVGLVREQSWMLDQNALSYAVEGAKPGEYKPVPDARPMSVGSFMGLWERNYKNAQV